MQIPLILLSHVISLATFNCRGFRSSMDYLKHLTNSNIDVIVLQEHWLWLFELDLLSTISADYTYTAVSDNHLNGTSDFVRGCGGVAILWKKYLNTSPLQFASDRMCGLSIDLNSTSATPRFLSILGIYMPCSEQCQDVYRNYFESVEDHISQLSHNPMLIMGDLNAHLNVSSSDHNRRGAMWNNLIETYQLCDLSTSQLASSPGFTYFSGARQIIYLAIRRLHRVPPLVKKLRNTL